MGVTVALPQRHFHRRVPVSSGMAKGETLQEAGLTFIRQRGVHPNREIIVQDCMKSTGQFELWFEKNDTPSAHLTFCGSRYEFVRSADSEAALG